MKPVTENILNIITLSRLTGPIFDKELRVASRRKRYYLLRSVYLVVLIILMTIIWTINILVRPSGSAVFMTSRMAVVGIATVTSIAWMQFVVAQILAGVLLSTAISDEIYRNTLAVLMTTPITGFQIVIGKILSKLLLIILLLAVSFPLLAIVRIFGGIPWDFLLLSFCLTITAALFTGSLSLFLSIFTRKSHNVLIQLIIILAVLYGGYPILVTIVDGFSSVNLPSFMTSGAIYNFNPFIVMITYTESAVTSTPLSINVDWIANCAIMLAASVLLILFSVLAVSKRRFHSSSPAAPSILRPVGEIRAIRRSPIIWKELNSSSTSGKRIYKLVAVFLFILIIIGAYTATIVSKTYIDPGMHVAFILSYLFFALLRTAVISASSITSEKEARTWPILLSTSLDRRDITRGKIIASIIKAWPFWLLIALHLVVFTFLRCIHPFALIPLAILFTLSAMTASSLGVFISSCCKKTSIAAVINIIVFLVCVVPVCCLNPLPFAGPLFITGLILGNASGPDIASSSFFSMDFLVKVGGVNDFLISSAVFVAIMFVYLLIAYVSFAVTQSNIRSKIF